VRSRLQFAACVRPLNFTVRRRPGEAVPPLGPIARTFVAMNRITGASMILMGAWLLFACVWRLLRGAPTLSWWYVVLGVLLIGGGYIYLRAPLWRQQREAIGDDSAHGN